MVRPTQLCSSEAYGAIFIYDSGNVEGKEATRTYHTAEASAGLPSLPSLSHHNSSAQGAPFSPWITSVAPLTAVTV